MMKMIRCSKCNSEEVEFIVSSKDLGEKASYGVDEEFGLKLAGNFQKQVADFVNKIRRILVA